LNFLGTEHDNDEREVEQRDAHMCNDDVLSMRAVSTQLSKESAGSISGTCHPSRSLGVPSPLDPRGRPLVLNNVLINHLHERSGQHIRVWCTLDIESDLCAGVQRVRCNPFQAGNGRDFSQYVAVIPPKKYSGIRFARFDMANEQHRRVVWYGRVELFFQCTSKVLQREAGARMFYELDTPWLIVLVIITHTHTHTLALLSHDRK
jgi:hypothetical protein